ncbi:hypothetical protein [Bacillus marinisedimentorum]|uniref:hypothetical protein n=1 Tax=Bacillus marinisedimentorum TaxID=1821260 RepID=UPI0008729D8F|nr:hypothetical protein [Bacillus marinisedimentorum]
MQKKLISLFENLYGWIAFVTMTLGVGVAGMFGVSFLIGGSAGESIAILGGQIMTWGIRLAAIAMVAGLLYTYVKQEHSLTLKSESEAVEKEIDEAYAGVEKAL